MVRFSVPQYQQEVEEGDKKYWGLGIFLSLLLFLWVRFGSFVLLFPSLFVFVHFFLLFV